VNSKYDLGSALLSPNYEPAADDTTDGFIAPESLPPMTEIKISSMHTMQLTVTRSFLGVLHNLTESFSLSSLQSSAAARHIVSDPLILVNSCGKELIVALGECKNLILSQEEPPFGGSITLPTESSGRIHETCLLYIKMHKYFFKISPLVFIENILK
jgi:hypothetical protein